MNYSVSQVRQGGRFLTIVAEFDVNGRQEMEIRMALWISGRYEIGNFAKNIRKL